MGINNMNRTEQLLQMRSEISTDTERSPLPLEQFQNSSLRPILKFQNNVFLNYFQSQLNGAEIPDFRIEIEQFVKLRLQKDLATRNTLLGMVLALLTEEEMVFFIEHKSDLTKRSIDMLAQRLAEQLKK